MGLPKGQNELILVLDDEESSGLVVGELLRKLGYRVVTHSDPAKALADFLVRPNDFQLIITDMLMPRMNGFAVARKIRSIRPELPILLSSGFNDTVEDGMESVSGVLPKPADISELAISVRIVLDR